MGKKIEDNEEVRLSDLFPGEKAVVVRLENMPLSLFYRLQSMGVYEGSRVYVERSFPEYLFRAGYTLIAINHIVAYRVVVHRLPR